jgi:ATP-dependent helicase YprA (DUF1998 family)
MTAQEIMTTENIVFVVGMLGLVFAVYHFFRNPQISIDKKQAIDEERRQKKDELIELRMKIEREFNEQKFCDFGKRLEDSFLLASNHTHSVDIKVDKLIQAVNSMDNELTRLQTIIEERIPKQK